MIEKEILRIIHELNTYNPQADEHNGKYIHKAWAVELDNVCRKLLTELNSINDNLDFVPDDNHSISDMANVGKSLMGYIKIYMPKHWGWNESPAEAVSYLHEANNQLLLERNECVEEIKRLREVMRKTVDENGHLSDGDNCTLFELREALSTTDSIKKLIE